MKIISNNTSTHHAASVDSNKTSTASDFNFSSNFKILNISTLKYPEPSLHRATQQSTDSNAPSTKSKQTTSKQVPSDRRNLLNHPAREHRHIAIKSAFSEQVTGKGVIEINANAVTKHLHITLLCLRQDAAAMLFRNNNQKSFRCSSKKSEGNINKLA